MRQAEVDRNLRLNLDWLSVEQIRLVFPAFDRIGGGASELLISAQNFYIRNVAALRDRRRQLNRAFDMQVDCIRRINRLHFLHQQSLRYALRDAEFLQHRRRGLS